MNLISRVAAAALFVLAGTAHSAHEEDPLATTTRAVFRILFVPTASVLSTGFTSVTTTAAAEEQKALALAALEDAAHFVDSGQLRGVLPMVMERLRGLDLGELKSVTASASDAELVDAVIASAEQALEQVEAYSRAAAEAARRPGAER